MERVAKTESPSIPDILKKLNQLATDRARAIQYIVKKLDGYRQTFGEDCNYIDVVTQSDNGMFLEANDRV